MVRLVDKQYCRNAKPQAHSHNFLISIVIVDMLIWLDYCVLLRGIIIHLCNSKDLVFNGTLG